MSFITKTFTTTCPGDLIGAINADTNIGVVCSQIIDPQNGTSIFEFERALTTVEDDALDALLASWACPIVPPPDTGSQVVNDELPPSTDTIWTSEKTNEEIQAAVATRGNYIPIAGTVSMSPGNKYLLLMENVYILPDISTLQVGDAITFARLTSTVPTIRTFDPTQLILTDIGDDTELLYDLTQDIVFVLVGPGWELQFGGQ